MLDVPMLLAKLDIPVIKRAGRRLWSNCPSPEHPDKDPSWFIWNDETSDRHGHHRCYGCGFRGGAIALVREIFGIATSEAKKWLQSDDVRYTPLEISVEIREQVRREEMQPPQWVQFAADYKDWPTLAVRYLTGPKRRVNSVLANRWGLGFAIKGTLAGRVWIPIRDPGCRLVSWQARSFIDDPLRYVTPDRVQVQTLLGAEHWPEAEDRRVVVVVEGPFDALAVDRATALPVGAIIGSNPSTRQMSALATFDEVVIMTDPDGAGDKAEDMLRGMSRWVKIHRARLPATFDPGNAPDDMLCDMLGPWMKYSPNYLKPA